MSAITPSRNLWRLVAHHEQPSIALEWMQKHSELAIGWGNVGDLFVCDDLRNAIRKAYPQATTRDKALASLMRFGHRARFGDKVIVVVEGKQRAVFEITGNYFWSDASSSVAGGDYFHRLPAQVLDLNARELWRNAGGFAEGESPYWSFALCGSSFGGSYNQPVKLASS